MKKATDQQIIAAYNQTGSVWKAGELLGMCGQTVHERLVKLGFTLGNMLTEDDLTKIKNLYLEGFTRGDGKLDSLCKELGRTKPFICRKAKGLKLTNSRRPMSDSEKEISSATKKEWFKNNPHPKGYLGKSHSAHTRKLIGEKSKKSFAKMSLNKKSEKVFKMLKTKYKRGNLHPRNREGCSWKAGWRDIGGKRCYFRSRWEANYARYLDFLKRNNQISDWEHEPDTFWFEEVKRGVRSYLPDFKVYNIDETHEYHEVKGWMDAKSKTKLKRMAKYHPSIKMVLIDGPVYKSIAKSARTLIKGWE